MPDKTSTPSRAESPAAERQRLERLLAEAKASLASLASPPLLPKWRDNNAMKAWVNTMLDRIFDVIWWEVCLEPFAYHDEHCVTCALKEAERGNIKPLRDAYPHLTPFLHPPKRRRGQRLPKAKPKGLEAAVADVSRIRDLWRQHFGRVKRRQGELSAEEIAAERNKLDVEKVRTALAHRARLQK
jgi:hypothetical protein